MFGMRNSRSGFNRPPVRDEENWDDTPTTGAANRAAELNAKWSQESQGGSQSRRRFRPGNIESSPFTLSTDGSGDSSASIWSSGFGAAGKGVTTPNQGHSSGFENLRITETAAMSRGFASPPSTPSSVEPAGRRLASQSQSTGEENRDSPAVSRDSPVSPPRSSRPQQQTTQNNWNTSAQQTAQQNSGANNPSPMSPQEEYEKQKKAGFGWGDAAGATRGASPGGGHTSTLDDSGEQEAAMNKADASLLNKLVHQKLLEVQDGDLKVKVENLQHNTASPLFSVRNFDELHLKAELIKAVADMGFNQPSKIQESALPVLLAHPPNNMIAQSQSGTGKTAAFVLTMLMRVDANQKYPQAVCLAPTYELALQIGNVVTQMGKYMPNVTIAYAVRGEKVQRGQKIEDQVIIGTPGTMLDWVLKFRCFDPNKVKVFVLDEADVMISQQGHQDQSIRIEKTMPKECQRLLFSATYDEQVMEFAERIITEPIIITLRRDEQTLDNIRQFYVECRNREDKYKALTNLYETLTIGQCMIFCATRKSAGWLAGKLTEDGHSVAILSGELDISQRAGVIQRFKNGHEKVLITTNVSARGIDVAQVSIVINYDMPLTMDKKPDFETYLHRIGRTGRFGKSGLAINFVDSQWSMNIMNQIQDHFGRDIKKLDPEDQDQLERLEEGKH